MMILFFFYTIILEAVYFLLSPILFAIFRFRPGSERLAIDYPKQRFRIMVHAASVGEINGIRQLLIELLNQYPELSILLTTNTKTGRKTVQNLHPRLHVMLSPLDVYHLRKKQLSLTNPEIIIIVETEIWPTLLFASSLKKIPVIFINARMSDKTLTQYSKFKDALNYVGKNVKAICTQTEADLQRFSQIFDAEIVKAGNLKFSVVQPEFDKAALRKDWGYDSEDKIIVMGSSRPGEETLLLKCYDLLKPEFPKLKLIIAPRHLDRKAELESIFHGRKVSYFSKNEPVQDIHIIDEMGHLLPAYAMCDIAIIGGSFYPFGGHNPLEAAYYSKPIIMGPHFESCKGSVNKLQNSEAIVISSVGKLYQNLRAILTEPDSYEAMGVRAKQVLEENKNSLQKHLEIIEKYWEQK